MGVPVRRPHPWWRLGRWFASVLLFLAAVAIVILLWPLVKRVSLPSADTFLTSHRPDVEMFLRDHHRMAAAKERLNGRWFTQVGDHLWFLVMQDGSYMVAVQAAAKEKSVVRSDIFWGRGSDGREFRSDFHYCIGLCVLMEEPQPASLDDFIALEARWRGQNRDASR